ncbi:MAG: division/cell wall cluster transcriptional repressor MraZ [Acidobacteriota bacterium]
MFRGSSPAKIDDRGRLKMPNDVRRQLEEEHGDDDLEIFVTSVEGASALVYPMPVWRRIERKLADVPSSNRAKKKYLERVNYYGQQLRLDAQGRVVIPQILRESAQIVGDVVVSGRLDHLEVWNRERFDQRLAAEPFTDDDFSSLAEHGI